MTLSTGPTVDRAVREATARLAAAGCPSPAVDARLLMAHALGIEPGELFFSHHDPAPAHYGALVDTRAQRIPLQHITGRAATRYFDVAVGPGVFVPRPETDLVSGWAADAVSRCTAKHPVVVDLCTGSAVVALSVAVMCPSARVYAVEIDERAAKWAEKNIAAICPSVTLVRADATDPSIVTGADGPLAGLAGKVDCVVSNPPYVPETTPVDPEVAADPHQAVFAGDDGMAVITPMAGVIAKLLRSGGVTAIEHDDTTGAAVAAVLAAEGSFTRIAQHHDMAGRDRFVTAGKL
ncbi:peptide chain release factor N(5)-glutamine methyltransferase [Corynebacterium mendelii]|uniref:peptide chain release factor N(5)-glutamine methyltransferase n=1 Tax=Corynebacterium mendelii TaxID=2765362 RepID=A0A939E3V1_9CORY|nr:peptide chain release factor N(5)-glutamine methyltransferase [Corynebacterium mendelii]MBN9644942.1 peptide chain release factor N(5)-glutamine methyltransferase [Corynebacterium mendelii]